MCIALPWVYIAAASALEGWIGFGPNLKIFVLVFLKLRDLENTHFRINIQKVDNIKGKDKKQNTVYSYYTLQIRIFN